MRSSSRMANPRSRRDLRTATGRAASDLRRRLGADLRRHRQDAGLSLRAVAKAAGIDPSHLSAIERGAREASLAVLAAVAQVLGLDVAIRLFAATGPSIRDRHQAPIVEALLASLSQPWRSHVEVAVRRPVRGVIDVVLVRDELVVAVEVHSELRSVEQIIRWSSAKAEALPSADLWARLLRRAPPHIDRLLVIRATRANRAIVDAHRNTFDTTFPASTGSVIAALRDGAPWPGPSLLWATTATGSATIVTRASARDR